MSAGTKIEWAHHTFNPWSGCEKVSAGCANCYAAALPPGMRRHAEWGRDRPRVLASEDYWRQPRIWDRSAAKAGERHRVFCASTADVFEAREDLTAARERLFNLISATPNLDWLLLTKRPEYAVAWWNRPRSVGWTERWLSSWPWNAWIGTSVEDQAAADERIPHLLRIPARVRFLSMEPLLGPVRLDSVLTSAKDYGYDPHPIAWVIVGGESGRRARPMHPDWARALRNQCVAAGVPFFFKQWGEFIAEPGGVEAGDYVFPDGLHIVKVGKQAAGRVLDGRTWDEIPQ